MRITYYLSLLLFFICIPVFAKKPGVYENARYGRSRIHLYKDGSYRWYHWGMCSRSHSSMNAGKWEMRKDTVIFHSIAKGSVKTIDTVIATGSPADSITIIVLDRNGNNVTSDMSFGWHVKGIGYYTHDGIYKSKDVPGAMVLVKTRPGATLALRTIQYFLSAACEIDVSKAGNFIVKLGIDEAINGGNYYPALSYGDPDILIKKGDTLSEKFEHPLMSKYGRIEEKDRIN